MSGILLRNFHEGNRSEYLANYLLSGIGISTPVPRQDDTGFDFYCQLADQEKGALTFGYPYVIQIKSDDKSIIHGNSDVDKWKSEQLEWIYRLKLPLLFGIVDKQKMEMKIFNCSPVRFIFLENPNASIIEFKHRSEETENEIGRPEKIKIDGWPENVKGDGFRYIVDLGNPIITLKNEDVYNEEVIIRKKAILRNVIAMEQLNNIYRSLNLPHFHWALKIKTNGDIKSGWIYLTSNKEDVIKNHFKALGPGLISLALNLFTCGQTELIKNLKPLMKEIPENYITPIP